MYKSVKVHKKAAIEEIARDLCSRYPMCTCVERDGHCSVPQRHAEIIYGLGYKKQIVGTWEHSTKGFNASEDYECSVCHSPSGVKCFYNGSRYQYCPDCGARMEEV